MLIIIPPATSGLDSFDGTPAKIKLKSTIIIINGGTNDIIENTSPYLLENTLDNITAMVDLAKANNIKVILTSVLPAYHFPWKTEIKPVQKN